MTTCTGCPSAPSCGGTARSSLNVSPGIVLPFESTVAGEVMSKVKCSMSAEGTVSVKTKASSTDGTSVASVKQPIAVCERVIVPAAAVRGVAEPARAIASGIQSARPRRGHLLRLR
jgi:hypothetical protein